MGTRKGVESANVAGVISGFFEMPTSVLRRLSAYIAVDVEFACIGSSEPNILKVKNPRYKLRNCL